MHKYIYILTTAISLACIAPTAAAKPFSPHHGAKHAPVFVPQANYAPRGTVFFAQKKISASDAKSIARKKVRDAKVIDIAHNRGLYKVRMQKKNGRVVDVYIDATSGRVQ